MGLLALVVHAYCKEEAALCHIVQLTLFGFVVHHFLPPAWRMPFFVAMSLVALGLVLGVANAAMVVSSGLVLIGVCHLPIAFGARVLLVSLLGAVLVAFQAGWVDTGGWAVAWPILASMFCFRMAMYLYDMKTQQAPFGFWRSLAYFFMSPNVCFPLFPLVDYKTFCRTYYNDEPLRIYQSGATWISRGLVQLLLYRVVYQFLLIDPAQVDSAGDLFWYMVASFLLYLKISGTFHLIVGMLHLFGFNLPETHHRWLLASSFVDYWQRINIYWKEFMAKLVFYPVHFRMSNWLQGWRASSVLMVSVLVSFFFTWLLHSYQWFWIRGTYLLSWPDALFWSILAVLLAVNMLWQEKFVKRRRLKQAANQRTLKSELSLAGRTVLTFVAICVLWSLWGAESVGDWLAMWPQATRVGPRDVGLIGGVLLAVGLGAVAMGRSHREWTEKVKAPAKQEEDAWAQRWWPGVVVAGSCLLLLAPLKYEVRSHINPQLASVMTSVRMNKLNRRDTAMLNRGYYEDLTEAKRFNPQLFELYTKMPANDVGRQGTGEAIKRVPDFRRKVLVPSKTYRFQNGVEIRTNAHGLRDREGYDLRKPDGVLRIAVVGSSEVMGWGVPDGETFENLVEDRLNAQNDGSKFERYELINFSVTGYGPIEKLMMAEQRALGFDPDVLFYVANNSEYQWVTERMVEGVQAGWKLPYDVLDELIHEAKVDRTTHKVLAQGRLKPYAPQVLSWVYQRVATLCREHEVYPVWVYVPQPDGEPFDRGEIRAFFEEARKSQFTILDLSDAFKGMDQASMRVSKTDGHPNVEAHRVLADCLYRKIQAEPQLSRYLPIAPSAASTAGREVDNP